ncbi:MAG: adenylate/guanylate cyclase domain-containing protein [Candidatus Limnocylindrales bacterium]
MESPGVTGPERRIVTILFADLVGFTSLAERLDPEDLALVQDAYFGAVRDVIDRHGGRLEKFIGDAAVAAFGVPRTLDDDALRAVSAGLALLNAVGDLGARLGLDADELRLRVGVNTGEVAVAADGPDAGRLSGDPVNVAARLQAAAEPGTVLLGEVTALAVAGAVELAPLPPLTLKGKAERVRASRVVALRAEPSRELAMGRLRSGLLGRTVELELLRAAAARTAAGAAPCVLIVAPPGVGKTRLVEEFAAMLERDPAWLVLRVRIASGAAGPFAPLARLLATALDAVPGREPTTVDGADRPIARLEGALTGAGRSPARAATVVEHVQELLGGSRARSETGADRASLFGSWLEALEVLAAGRITMWLLEDLHWAGPDLLAFLATAATSAQAAGRLIVATGRPSVLELGGLAGGSWERIELSTLAPLDAGALVDQLSGGALPAALVERVAARSDGNCLFIEELLRTWVGTGILVEGPAGALRLTIDPDEVRLPPTVQAIYAAQLDDLPRPARLAARRGSVSGRRFPADALPILGVEDAGRGVAALGRRGIVAGPYRAPIVGDELAFRHALLRDAAYASLGRAERAELHVRLARWLEIVARERVDQVAAAIGGHYADAVDAAPALAAGIGEGLDRRQAAQLAAGWLERAGTVALDGAAYAGATDLFRRSLERTDPEARLDLARRWRLLAESTAVSGDLEDAAGSFETAVEHARATLDDPNAPDDAVERAREAFALAAAGLSHTRYEQIRFAEALDIAEAALAQVGQEGPEGVRLRLARAHGIEGVTNDYQATYLEADRILEAARATGDARLEFDARRTRLGLAMNVDRATPEEWVDLARDARYMGRWPEAVAALVNASALRGEGDTAAATSLLDEAEVLAEARGLSERLAWISFARSEAALAGGAWDAAVAAALKAIGIAERFGYDRAAVRTWFVLTPMAEARRDRGILEHAAAWFERHAASFPHSPYGLVQHAAVELRLAAAGLGSAPTLDDEVLLEGLGLDDGSADWLAAVERIVAGALEAGGPELASVIVAQLPPIEPGEGRPLVRASGALIRAGVGAATAGAAAMALAQAREALREARAAKAPWWTARAIRLLAGLEAASAAELSEADATERRLGYPGSR